MINCGFRYSTPLRTMCSVEKLLRCRHVGSPAAESPVDLSVHFPVFSLCVCLAIDIKRDGIGNSKYESDYPDRMAGECARFRGHALLQTNHRPPEQKTC